jgi:hypothetical protein
MSELDGIGASNGRLLAIDVVNKHLYGTTDTYFFILDIADPSDFSVLDTLSGSSFSDVKGLALDIENSVAYLAYDDGTPLGGSSTQGGFLVMDISDTSAAAYDNYFVSTNMDNASGLVVDLVNSVAYVCGLDALTSVDISTPTAVSEISFYTSANVTDSEGIAIDITNEIVYVVTGTSKITAIDISDPSSMSESGSLDISSAVSGGDSIAIDTDNQIAYILCSADNSITSVDISDPTDMSVLDTYSSNYLDGTVMDNPQQIILDMPNDTAYVTAYAADRLVVIDISNPSDLSILTSYTSANLDGIWAIAIDFDDQG